MESIKRRAKRKVALLMGFCGTGYHGMQINKDVPTIEAELVKALCSVGAIDSFNQDSLAKISFQRCARTDKGVHALGQVVSAKLVLPPECEQASEPSKMLAEKLNSVLLEQIRVWGHVRTSDKFNAKQACNGRVYEYFMPTYCLRPFPVEEKEKFNADISEETVKRIRERFDFTPTLATAEETAEKENNKRNRNEEDEDESDNGGDELEDEQQLDTMISAEEMSTIRKYRLTRDDLEHLRKILKQFEGTHNYHNFTIGRPHWNPSARRHMVSVTSSDPFVRSNTEWISIRIQGQSFMLHQIRKMIGFSVLMMRTGAPLSIFSSLTGEVRVNIPKAPSLGLFLQEPLFDIYNKQTDRLKATNAGFMGGKVDFSQYHEEMQKFKEQWIYSKIVEEEEKVNSFENWIRFIMLHSDEFGYLRQDGFIHDCYRQFAKVGIYDKSRQTKTARIKAGKGMHTWKNKRKKSAKE